jgi:ribosome-binding factor A
MSRRRRVDPDLTALSVDRGPEDGSDPKEFHRKPWDQPRQAGRKSRQLCEQVKNALHGAFAACADPVLQSLTVVGVEPAPHTGRLRVLVAVPSDGGVTPAEAQGRLLRAVRMLRAEAAAAISRRYAPELAFEVIGSAT